MTTAKELPTTIRASVHEDAISRVTRFFNASTSDTLQELFQNARRAHATRVAVTIKDQIVSVTDDGDGIANPATLLSFGLSEWDRQVTRNEDPAGMGIYALSRNGAHIRSRHRSSDATWEVQLTPEHFLGRAEATVVRLPEDNTAPGTTVSFEAPDASPFVELAARYFTLPVTCNGKTVERRDFLSEAIRTEKWQGGRIGVYGERPYRLYHGSDIQINFHGVLVRNAKLPTVEAIDKTWHVLVDIDDCPQLELMLPARREPVQNEFMEELRLACKRAIYKAMLTREDPVDVPFNTYADARSMGINLPIPKPHLSPWLPEERYGQNHQRRNRQEIDPVSTILMPRDLMESCDQQTLYRAARRNGVEHRLWQSQPALSGYSWYDQLTVATKVDISFTEDGQATDVQDLRELPQWEVKVGRPDNLTFTIETAGPGGKADQISIPGDIAFTTEEASPIDEPIPLVTKDSDITVAQLTEMMMDAYFQPSEEIEADSVDTQRDEWELTFHAAAIATLQSTEEAVTAAVQEAVSRHVQGHVPHGYEAHIHIKPGQKAQVKIRS